MNSPELVLADEPTGNLDRKSAMQVMDLIGQINREEGTPLHSRQLLCFLEYLPASPPAPLLHSCSAAPANHE
jgi:ABC-type multidrug transport system ATPase subunit